MTVAPSIRPRENAYGSLKRLRWMERHIKPGDRVLEVGCGTGVMITFPLCEAGVEVLGLDLDPESVAYGQRVAREIGVNPDVIRCQDLNDVSGLWNVIIVSEVLEHQTDDGVRKLLQLIRSRMAPGGTILVTSPNGRGWFELESWLWFKLKLGRLLYMTRVALLIATLKRRLIGGYEDSPYLSTLDGSPHLQRFSLESLSDAIADAGFLVTESDGSVLMSGPFSHTLFTGIEPVMALNVRLGSRFKRRAASFFVAGQAPGDGR